MRRLALLTVLLGSLVFAPSAFASWCGTSTANQDLPDLVTGAQVHAVVALPADAPDTFAATANRLADDAASMTAWWQGQDPTRIPRFDTANFGGNVCLDITFVRLPGAGSSYSGASAAFSAVAQQLLVVGLSDVFKKYLVYYDGPSVAANVCGTGAGDFDSGPAYAVMWLQGCIGVPYDAVSAHELLHALGALPGGAPSACPGDAGHPCDSKTDVLYPYTDGSPLTSQVLDFNHDDYYAHSGTWPDIQDSIWMHRLDLPPVALTVGFAGRGEVTSDLPGVDCTAGCTTEWDSGSKVLLQAEGSVGQRFVRWQGACTGYDCTLDLTQPAAVTAVFGPTSIPLKVSIAGKGTVACTPTCTKTFPGGNPLRLRAVPARGWTFAGWSGGCKGTRVTCSPATDFALTVKATFRRK